MRHGIGKKKIFKKIAHKCKICGEDEYPLLDVHRILHGEDGGEYTIHNCVCVCNTCHRLHHSADSKLTIIKLVNSTKGKLLYIIDKNGYEDFV